MIVHTATVRGRCLACEPRAVVQHGVNADAIDLDLDGEWADLARVSVVLSRDGTSTALPWRGEPVAIPYELMEEPGALRLSVVGRTGADLRIVTRAMAMPLEVVEGGAVDGSYEPGDPVLDEVQQVIEDAEGAAEAAREAAARCRTISCGSGVPGGGGVAGDLYIDSETGKLYRLESDG